MKRQARTKVKQLHLVKAMKPTDQALINDISSIFTERPSGNVIKSLQGREGVPLETIRRLAEGALDPKHLAKLKAELEAVDAAYMRGARLNDGSTPASAGQQAHEAKKAAAERVMSGKDLDPIDALSPDEFKARARHQRQVGREAMLEAGRRVMALIKPVADTIDLHIKGVVKGLLEEAQKRHAEFGVPFVEPGLLERTIKAAGDRIAWQMRKWETAQFIGSRPAEAAAAIGIVIHREELPDRETIRVEKKKSFLQKIREAGQSEAELRKAELDAKRAAALAKKEEYKRELERKGIIRLSQEQPDKKGA